MTERSSNANPNPYRELAEKIQYDFFIKVGISPEAAADLIKMPSVERMSAAASIIIKQNPITPPV